jgi:hypothetical protein
MSVFLWQEAQREIPKEVNNEMEMILKAMGPLSRQYLAKNEDRKGYNKP